MYFLLSGEGPTDIGEGRTTADICEGADFLPGPMTAIVDQIVENKHNYSPYGCLQCGIVHKKVLERMEVALKPSKKSIRLPGVTIKIETRHFFSNARSLARIAKDRQKVSSDEVVAILFRDADSKKDEWEEWSDKRKSIVRGFEVEGFDNRGVPMIPKPKSEAWLLCALNPEKYQNSDALENRSASPKSPNDLKEELETLLGETPTRELLYEKVKDQTIDYTKIDMLSFDAFKKKLCDVLNA